MSKQKKIINKQVLSSNIDNFLLYTTPVGDVKVEVLIHGETIWLDTHKMAKIFDIDRTGIIKHIKNIYRTKELNKNSTCVKIAQVAKDGKMRKMDLYNLDMIISVGYRVNSLKGIQFRIWATQILEEYTRKGFAMNDERLKNPNQPFGKDYFDEQLARIRDIRSSERRFYQKVTDIYAKCSADYKLDTKITKNFFATVQNKLHWSITGKTAAEIVSQRANSEDLNMGLKTWKNNPGGKIRKSDVSIAKNYLNKDELDKLNRIVTMYLDFAEFQASNNKVMYMKDWIVKLDAFLKFNEQDILNDLGKISSDVAKELAEKEYEKFNTNQNSLYVSDFDVEVRNLLVSKKKL